MNQTEPPSADLTTSNALTTPLPRRASIDQTARHRMALLEERLWGLSGSGNPPEEIVRGWMTPQATPQVTAHNELETLEKMYNELKTKKARVDEEYEKAVSAHKEQVKLLKGFVGPEASKKIEEMKLSGLEVLRIECDIPPDVAALIFR